MRCLTDSLGFWVRLQAAATATPAAGLPARNEDTTVVVVGPTGYIGRFVTKELIRRGYKVSRTCLIACALSADAAPSRLLTPWVGTAGDCVQPRAQRYRRQEGQGRRHL